MSYRLYAYPLVGGSTGFVYLMHDLFWASITAGAGRARAVPGGAGCVGRAGCAGWRAGERAGRRPAGAGRRAARAGRCVGGVAVWAGGLRGQEGRSRDFFVWLVTWCRRCLVWVRTGRQAGQADRCSLCSGLCRQAGARCRGSLCV